MSYQLNRWTLFIIFDPASASTFGVLFVLFNPFTKKIIVCDEIYEKDPKEMTTSRIWARVREKRKALTDLGLREIRYVYDEAATWFRNESLEEEPTAWLEPTTKSKADKESGLSLFKDIISKGFLQVAAECVCFIKECENYIKDEKGKIPKVGDHLIDCFRYFLDAAGFEFKKETPPKESDPDTQRRYHTPDTDFSNEESLEEI